MQCVNIVNAQSQAVTVQTSSGVLRGLAANGVSEYKGIAYATANRFEMPVAARPWVGVKDATKFASNCPQAARFNLTEESLNEDCLYLNVAVPSDIKANEKLPVMLWIPGGGFVGGGSNLYKLDQMAREGRMVIVSMNYRVGLFGFMPHPAMDSSSNGDLGLEDQREAMRWVQKNIAAFGGDPNNVTVAGESAGAGSICQHLASPEVVTGLFQKALLISGACLQVLPTLNQALATPIWKSVSNNPKDPNRRFKCPVPGDTNYSEKESLSCLKKISVAELLEAQTYEAGNSILSFVPVTGNKTVPRSFKDAVATGNVVRVPIAYGGAQNELRLYVGYDALGDNANHTKYPANLENANRYYLPAFYGSDEKINQKILARYFGDAKNPKNLNGATLGSMLSDFNPHVGINNCFYLRTSNALNGVSNMPPIYQFEFGDPNALVLGVGIAKGSNPGFPLGAVHSSILNYFFPNLSNTAAINAPNLPPPSEKLGKQMTAYLASFMRDGKPSLAGQPVWPRYDGTKEKPSSKNVMFFSPDNIHTYSAYGGVQAGSKAGHQCAFWNEIYPE
ncbi:carboxylesterase family protein [Polynucleobacter asymbioticus]|nr:carboxylesterase family protein [Polynucleobacter asymbioticus]